MIDNPGVEFGEQNRSRERLRAVLGEHSDDDIDHDV